MGRARRKSGRKGRKDPRHKGSEPAHAVSPPTAQARGSDIKLLIVLSLLVMAIIGLVHWPCLSAQALSFDDTQYVVDNPVVQHPSWASAKRFFTEVLNPSTVDGYYQPLAMVSLMGDVAMGASPDDLRVFHRTSLILHLCNSFMVIVLMSLLFDRLWPAVLVGLLFGVHPMTVEPICWVGERKTLLAAFFGLACLISYVRFARQGGWLMYALSLVMCLLALMSKPTTTPLPVLILLLDYWPLKQLNQRTFVQKIPYFILAGVFAIITIVSQGRSASVTMPTEYSASRILLIVCHNIIFYLYKIAWPTNLSSHYPFPESISPAVPMVGVGLLGTSLLIAALIVSWRKTRAFVTGWLFFFVAIFPTIGVIGFTNVIAADKYAYLPAIGLLLILAWGLTHIWNIGTSALSSTVRHVGIVSSVAVLALLASVSTRHYLMCWHDTESLHKHMIALAPRAGEPRVSLAYFLDKQGRQEDAIAVYREALRVQPKYLKALNNLGDALAERGEYDEAIALLSKAVKLKPDFAIAQANLGKSLSQKGMFKEAIEHLSEAERLLPDNAHVHVNFGNVLIRQGRIKEAIPHFVKAIAARPDRVGLRNRLGIALARDGQMAEATQCFRRALQINPDSKEAHSNLANVLISQGQTADAIQHYKEAVRIDPNVSQTHNNLANALFRQGKIDEAIVHYKEAIRLDPANAEAHFNLGLVLEKQGRLSEAVREYRQTVQLKPSHTVARQKIVTLTKQAARSQPAHNSNTHP